MPRGEPSAPVYNSARPRLGAWAQSAAAPASISHYAGRKSAAPALFRAHGRRARKCRAPISEPETPCARARASGRTAASRGGATPAPGSALRPSRRGPVAFLPGTPRDCWPWARAARDRRYTPSPRDIARMTDRPRPGRGEPTPERQAKGRWRRGRPRLQPRNTAPVFLDTSATILDIAASISVSVNVRSRGCRVM